MLRMYRGPLHEMDTMGVQTEYSAGESYCI